VHQAQDRPVEGQLFPFVDFLGQFSEEEERHQYARKQGKQT
jgi:hypothetical protein